MLANFAGKCLDLSRVHVMGVLNVTPDSFSDGGQFHRLDQAVAQAQRMTDAGATLIDVGGESTRPGAAKVSLQEEMDRVCPVVEQILSKTDAVVSVDTSTPALMKEVLSLGVGMINDVRAFTREGAVEAVVQSDAMLCAMHMQGQPDTMQASPRYEEVVSEVVSFLMARAGALIEAGVGREQVVLDPGFGFGKTLEHNLALLNQIDVLVESGYPVLIGLSRKSMFGQILGKSVDQRLHGSVAGAVVAAFQGASILRVHDVSETVDAVKVMNALRENQGKLR